MDYDWKQIFKNKTNNELYDIVIGKVVLSNNAVKFAKLELEKRNFDFSNMEANKKAWKLSNLIEEEHNAQLEITGRKFSYISLKIYLLVVLGFVLVYFYLNYYTKTTFEDGLFITYITIITFLVVLNNFIHLKQKKFHKERVRKIQEIKNELIEKGLLKKGSPIQKDIQKHYEKEKEGLNTIRIFYIVVLTILMSILIIKAILIFV